MGSGTAWGEGRQVISKSYSAHLPDLSYLYDLCNLLSRKLEATGRGGV